MGNTKHTMAFYTIKATFDQDDLRRFQISSSASYVQLTEKLSEIFADTAASNTYHPTRITWVDEDGDAITVKSNDDWRECTQYYTKTKSVGGKTVIRLAVQMQSVAPKASSAAAAMGVATTPTTAPA